ncbi:MAG: hypothetical protein IPL69_18865 [Saprospiraceae bacterium]|nr:hypothetical protein [Candidatus Brachybacter algidus]
MRIVNLGSVEMIISHLDQNQFIFLNISYRMKKRTLVFLDYDSKAKIGMVITGKKVDMYTMGSVDY